VTSLLTQSFLARNSSSIRRIKRDYPR